MRWRCLNIGLQLTKTCSQNGKWVLLTVLEDAAPVSQPPFDTITFDLSSLWAD